MEKTHDGVGFKHALDTVHNKPSLIPESASEVLSLPIYKLIVYNTYISHTSSAPNIRA